MTADMNMPREGDLHSVVTIGAHSFELRYGYCDERDRSTGEPYILYPDLESAPLYTQDGHRIVTALQNACRYYTATNGREREDCCYTCIFYPHPGDEIGICLCEEHRAKHTPKEET